MQLIIAEKEVLAEVATSDDDRQWLQDFLHLILNVMVVTGWLTW